jgi:hypothetical protein
MTAVPTLLEAHGRCGPSASASTTIHGVDFTSAPTARKPITIASGTWADGALQVDRIDELRDFAAFESWLTVPGPWIGAFDFPFGLPRELVRTLGWPLERDARSTAWERVVATLMADTRRQLIARLRAFCDARPAGGKFAHRATDRPAGSSPSMKWVNPPVALMLHAGAPRLMASGVHIPGLRAGDGRRVALEGYPGLLARAIVGRRSYKSDDRARQTGERLTAREAIVGAIESARHPLGLRVRLSAALREHCVADPTGDRLDAVLCAVQAAWAWQRRDLGYGLPEGIDPIEGWIVTAGHAGTPEA